MICNDNYENDEENLVAHQKLNQGVTLLHIEVLINYLKKNGKRKNAC